MIATVALLLATQSATAACQNRQSSSTGSRSIADTINERGLAEFRKLSVTEHGVVVMSPLLRWYADCAQAKAAQPFVETFRSVPGRFIGSVGAQRTSPAVVAVGENAYVNATAARALPGAQTLPWYGAPGITGVRLDSSAGSLSLYLFTATPMVTVPYIADFQQSLTLANWKWIVGDFKPQIISGMPDQLWANGESYVPGERSMVERSSMQLERTALHFFGTATASSALDHDAATFNARVSPADLLLFVLTDSKTGAIIEIGANVLAKERP